MFPKKTAELQQRYRGEMMDSAKERYDKFK
jgi:hypothetical protein